MWVYNVNRDQIEKTFSGHNGFVRAIEFDKKRNTLLTGGEDETLRFWSFESCECLKALRTTEMHSL